MMNFEQIQSDIQNRNYKPVYFLMGEEPYFIDKITDLLTSTVLEESQKPFNLSISLNHSQNNQTGDLVLKLPQFNF